MRGRAPRCGEANRTRDSSARIFAQLRGRLKMHGAAFAAGGR